MNIEQQRTSGRLLRQLPANKIKETTTIFTRSRHVNKNSKSSPNRSEKITGENQRQSPSRRLQTDLVDLDTNRSLSSCPTYSSLSRKTPETRVSEYKPRILIYFVRSLRRDFDYVNTYFQGFINT
jgi:hypothetical protein